MSVPKGKKDSFPFGNPDGSRADIEEIQQGFVMFGGGDIWGGLATKWDDLTARVIVGRKGSGKTIYLRRLHAYASNQESLFADNIQQGVPTTENIIKFCQLFEENILTEKWMIIWHRAILRSIFSHLMCNKALSHYYDREELEDAVNKYSSILRMFRAPVSIYSQVTEMIQQNHTRHQFSKFLEEPSWQEFEYYIGELIRTCPPICFYIDAVDEEFSHAPMYWHRCQKGLFYQTMRLLRDSRLGGRLHIVICIRDIVLSSVYRSEHRSRYHKEPHIRILNWDKNAIRYFLREKVSRLSDNYFKGDLKNGKTVDNWLGIKDIWNDVRQIHEPIEDYLLRHTRLLPRDIVAQGNAICESVAKAKVFEKDKKVEDVVRKTVAGVAKFLGDEQLTICGNHIASNAMPRDAGGKGYSEVYTGNKEYVRGVTDDLKKLIRFIGKDRFSHDDLKRALNGVPDYFGKDSDPFSVLWQSGLIGYIEQNNSQEEQRFYSEANMDEFTIPLNKREYIFHSCLIDSVGLTPIGKKPIGY